MWRNKGVKKEREKDKRRDRRKVQFNFKMVWESVRDR